MRAASREGGEEIVIVSRLVIVAIAVDTGDRNLTVPDQ
jgi:hypothetical protein